MRRFYFHYCASLLMLMGLMSAKHSYGQTVTLGSLTGSNSYFYGPYYRSSTASTFDYSKYAYLYTNAELGIPSGAIITNIEWYKASGTITGNNEFSIFLENSAATSLTSGTTWGTFVASATSVYSSTTQQFTAANDSWESFTLTTPFTYTGSSLLILTDHVMTGTPTGANDFYYNSAPGMALGAASGSVLTSSTTLSSTSYGDQRPTIRITYIPGAPCTAPPVPGTVSIAPATNVCSGSTINLNLAGNSFGSGQTYEWQAGPTANGPFTPLAPGSTTIASSTTITSTTYYRAAVTCGSSTEYSDTVLVTVPPLFPAGTYTIGGPAGPTNFATFADAANAIGCGIAGPIVLNVTAGTYTNDQFILGHLNTTSTNNITINGNGATMSFLSSNTNERGAIQLNGADHVTVNNLNIIATGSTSSEYGSGVYLTNDADSNTFTGLNITLDTTIASSNYIPIVISGATNSPTTSGSNCDGNTFSGNTLNGGYYGVVSYGNSSTPYISNNTFTNNVIKNYYAYGFYVNGNHSTLIEGNDLSRPTRTNSTTFAGIYMNGTSTAVTFNANRIHNAFDAMTTSTSSAYPLYCVADATAADPIIFSNNLIYDINNSGTIYGVYNSGAAYNKYYHNTISLDDLTANTSSATRGIYQVTNVQGVEFINNIVSIKRGGSGTNYGIYKGTAATPITANYNNYFIAGSGTNHIGYEGGSETTLADWQTASGQDLNSSDLAPLFSSATDFTPGNSALDNTGTPVGITTDIMNAARSATVPDIGAYEFTIPPCLGTPTAGTAFINGAASATECNGGNLALTLQGFSTGAGITIQWQSSPMGQFAWTNIPGATTPTFNTTFTGATDYQAVVTCLGAQSTSNVVTATLSPFYFCYCSPNTGVTLHSSTSNYATNVEIPGTSLNSGLPMGAGGYTFADPTVATNTAVIAQGVPYTLNITQLSTLANYNSEVWIDWDRDGLFEASEYYLPTESGNMATTTFTAPILPAGLGMTGMRVRTVYSTTSNFGDTGACDNISIGRETEDYVITVVAPPTCFPPSSLNASVVTHNAATIDWAASSTPPANGYDFYFSTANTNPTAATAPSGSVSAGILTTSLSGLTPATPYYVWVRGNCGSNDYSTWNGPLSFTTACAPVTAPFSETFDISATPSCWSNTGVENWLFTKSATYGAGSAEHTGNNGFYAWVDDSEPSNVGTTLTSPLIDISSLTNARLRFYLWSNSTISTLDTLIVQAFDGTSWITLDSISQSLGANWQEMNYYLSSLAASTIQVRFIINENAAGSFQHDVSIDDIYVESGPTCPSPSSLTATGTTATGATLGWTENGIATQWSLEYGPQGFTPGTGTFISVANTPATTLSGLASGTSYEFYVRSICGPNDSSAWTGPTLFATLPPNDSCQFAEDITDGLVHTGTTAGATETMTPCDATTTTANDVWYSFTTGSVGGTVTVTVITTGTMDVVVQGFSGTCGSLTGMVPTASTTLTGTCIDGPAAGTEFGDFTVAPNTTYYVRVYGFNSLQGTFTIQAVGTPLAIKLESINAVNVGNRNRIDWATASEEVGDYFELERSTDGRNYSKIATVPAKGEASSYSYWDAAPAIGRNHYRLNMKDAAGNGTYSKEVVAIVKEGGEFSVVAHPNPVSDKVQITIYGTQGNNPVATLMDVTGKLIRTVNIIGNSAEIDMSGLAQGAYLIRYTDATHSKTIKVTKR